MGGTITDCEAEALICVGTGFIGLQLICHPLGGHTNSIFSLGYSMANDSQSLFPVVLGGVILLLSAAVGIWGPTKSPPRQRCTDAAILLTGLAAIRRRRRVHVMMIVGGGFAFLCIAYLLSTKVSDERVMERIAFGLIFTWLACVALAWNDVMQSRCPRCGNRFHGSRRGNWWFEWSCSRCKLPLRATEVDLQAEDT